MDKSFLKRCLIIPLTVLLFAPCCSKRAQSEDKKGYQEPSRFAHVREPAVSGSFYPNDPQDLQALVHSLLHAAREDPGRTQIKDPVRMILVPHAGYVFSGRTQAYAYAELSRERYDTVLLIGSPHRVPVNGASVYCGDGFRMPWGIVPVDRELAEAIVRSSDLINGDELPHLLEHSLEVQLPFLNAVLESFSIVPILIMGDEKTLDEVADAVLRTVQEASPERKILYVISTDLSHFPKKGDAIRCDREMVDAFMSLDANRLLEKEYEIMKRGIPNLACTMCGIDAAYVGLKIAGAIGVRKAALLHMSVSSDAGIKGASEDRVVGYAAVALLSDSLSNTGNEFEPLSKGEEEFLLKVARISIEEYLRNGRLPDFHVPVEYAAHLNERRGVFVTLYKGSSTGESSLRGCIGCHTSDLPLLRAVELMAIRSAFQDPRFPPVRAEELKEISIEISVYLTGLIPLSSIQRFVPGRDGIILQKGSRTATFLPHVALSQGWTREQTLQNLCLKAGLAPDAWRQHGVQFFVYRTQVIHAR